MRWRFKRRDFTCDTVVAVQRVWQRGYAVAISGIDAVWQSRDAANIWAIFTDVAALPAAQPSVRWTWLYQIRGADPMSQRCRIRWDGRKDVFRYASGQSHFWQQFDSVVMVPRLYEFCRRRLIRLERRAWTTQRIIKQGWL